jgi:hypothetical protein
MQKVQVKLTDKTVEATVVKKNPKTIWVQLSDGNVIKRHKKKHIIKWKHLDCVGTTTCKASTETEQPCL